MVGMLVTDGVITGGTIHMLGMADGVVKVILIMALIMDGTTEDSMVETNGETGSIMAGVETNGEMGSIMAGVEINGEMDLIIMDLTMAGVAMEDFVMQIMAEVILMEGQVTKDRIGIIKQPTAQDNE
jgi:hypothetical protein